MRAGVLLFLVALLAAGSASAKIYKCTAPDGSVHFSDRKCAADAEKVQVRGAAAPTQPGRSLSGLTDQERRILKEREERLERNRERALAQQQPEPPNRRRVPTGIKCPTDEEIRKAVRAHEVMLCMTPEEVEDAERFKYDEPDESARLLDNGMMVTEWFYDQRPEDWPLVVRFRNGHVVGYE